MASTRDFAALAEQAVVTARPLLALEYHPAAVAALDAFIDVTWGEDGLDPSSDLWQPNAGQSAAILRFGAFLGELARRELGGEWRDDPNPENVLNARVVIRAETTVFAVAQVYKRLKNGAAERLLPFYDRLRATVGRAATPSEAEGWMRQARRFGAAGRADLALWFSERALVLGPAPAARAAIEALRADWTAAESRAEDDARDNESADARARLAGVADEGRRALAAFGVDTGRGALTFYGVDAYLDETFGQGPVDPARRRPDTEHSLGAFLGEVLRERYSGSWLVEDALPVERARVGWPSGLALGPFDVVQRRMVKGGPGVLEQVGTFVGLLCRQGDTTDPSEDPAAWFAQAEAFAGMGRLLLALRTGTVAIGFDGGDRAERRLRLAEWCRALGRAAEEAKHVEAARRLDPRSVRPALGDAPSLEACEAALDHDPADARALVGKVRALLALGRAREAFEWAEACAGRDDCEPERAWLAARAADAVGDVVAAHERYARAADHPRLPEATRERAAARARALAALPAVRMAAIERLPDLASAVEAYARLNEEAPQLAEAWRERGVGLAMLGRPDEALACLRRAAQLEPTEPKSYDHEAVTLARVGRLDEAIAALERGLAACPASGTLRTRRGVFLTRAGRNEEALRAFDESIAVDPGYPDAWAFKGDLEQRIDRTPQAIASIERYLAARRGSREKRVDVARRQLWALRHPGRAIDSARARRCADQALQRSTSGALAEALAELEAAVDADPFLEEAWWNRGTCLLDLGRAEAALASFGHVEELGGPSSRVADAMAACLFRLGRGADSVAAYDRALAAAPSSPDALRGKARALVRLGRPEDALPLYARLLARAPASAELARERAEALRAAGRDA